LLRLRLGKCSGKKKRRSGIDLIYGLIFGHHIIYGVFHS
jgi:hypothetical protein